MKTRMILFAAALAAAALVAACGGGANTANNAAKPANNSNSASNATTNTTSSSNANSSANSAAAPASEGAAQDFTLVNKTGVVIDKLFVSPADKDEWGEDILGKDQMADGESWEIKFHPKEKADKWDLKVV